jgi:uncharacterized sodium:solute symporter family permease YidK
MFLNGIMLMPSLVKIGKTAPKFEIERQTNTDRMVISTTFLFASFRQDIREQQNI